MNRLKLIFCIVIFTSCGQQEPKTTSEVLDKFDREIIETTNPKVIFHKVDAKAILLGKSIKLLDNQFKEIKDISYLNEQFIKITEISDEYYKSKPTDDYCQELKYVKIKTNEFEGYVDGRKIYELINHTQNRTTEIDHNEISFTATKYFGVGVSNDDGLTFCSVNTPVVFSDKNTEYEGLIKMVKNKNYDSDYPFFELKDDDGANDEILDINKQDDKYLLKIKRTYQEGATNLLISIYKGESGKFVAEILENEQTEEENN